MWSTEAAGAAGAARPARVSELAWAEQAAWATWPAKGAGATRLRAGRYQYTFFQVCQGVLVDAVALARDPSWNRIQACTLIGRELKGDNFGADKRACHAAEL
jgi:hypothetical protein